MVTSRLNPRIKSLDEVFKLTNRDMRTMTTSMDKQFRVQEKRLFASEGSSGGKRWKRLNPRYAKQKRRKYGSRKIMQREGDLRRGLTLKNHPDHVATYQLSVVSSARIRLGTRNIVAAYHGAGGTGGSARKNLKHPKLPKRDTMQMTDKQRMKYYRIVSDYLIKTKLDRARRALRAGAIAIRGRG